MMTAMAVAVVETMTMAAMPVAMATAAGTDNNQLKVAAEKIVVAEVTAAMTTRRMAAAAAGVTMATAGMTTLKAAPPVSSMG